MQVREYLEEDGPQINYQFDVQHFSKNIKNKLIAAGKKFSCTALQKLTKSIINHFWWAYATREENEQLFRDMWVFCFMFKINIVGQQVIYSVNVNIQS